MGRGNTNLIGRQFGMLIVVASDGKKWGRYYWACKCECGNTKSVRGTHLTHGKIVSCGCKKFTRKCEISKEVQSVLGEYTGVYRHYYHAAKRRGYSFELSPEFFKELVTSNCFYCGSVPSNRLNDRNATNVLYSGIDRAANEIGYIENNVVPCCIKCNLAKHTLSQKDFLFHIEKIAVHQWRAQSKCEVRA